MSHGRIVKKQVKRWIVLRVLCTGGEVKPRTAKVFGLSRSTMRKLRARVAARIARYGERA